MLFLTYQQMGKGNWFEQLQSNRDYNEHLGFSPIWAVAFEDYKTAMVSALNIAPNCPDICYIIQTDDYIRLDKIAYYNDVKDNNIDLSYAKYITDTCDDLHSEFLLNAEKLVKTDVIMAIPVLGLENEDMRQTIADMLHQMYRIPDPNVYQAMINISNDACSYVRFMDPSLIYAQVSAAGFPDDLAEHKAIAFNSKRVFDYVFMPFIYQFAHKVTKVNSGYLKAMAVVSHKLDILQNKFSEWSYNDCTVEIYDKITSDMKNYIIDNDAILLSLAANEKISPNDKCPCGSGKKYKKCHGMYINT